MEVTVRSGTASAQTPAPEPKLSAVAARRAQMQAKAAREHQEEPEAMPEAAPREDVESVELSLPDGRVVEFGPPNGVSLTLRVATFPDMPPRAVGLVQVLMCVRSIDGQAQRPLNNMVDVQKLANTLGDPAIDLLATLYTELWPPLSPSDLPTIKKNLRRG